MWQNVSWKPSRWLGEGRIFGDVDIVTRFGTPAFLRAHKAKIDQVFINPDQQWYRP